MPSTLPPPLTADEIDDLIYYTRIADLPALKCEVSALSTAHHCGADAVLGVAVDEDSGNCLLHYAGGNGSEDILKYLLSLLPTDGATRAQLASHANHQGNTPLHYTALNHHLACVQMLVAAGADPTIVNKAGHDAVFEAERATVAVDESGDLKTGEKAERGRKCVEWLLGCKEGTGLESGVKGGRVVEGEAEGGAEGDAVMAS